MIEKLVELVGIEPNDLIVANDGVHQTISLTRLHLATEYGPLRSNSTHNSNRLAWELPQTSVRVTRGGAA